MGGMGWRVWVGGYELGSMSWSVGEAIGRSMGEGEYAERSRERSKRLGGSGGECCGGFRKLEVVCGFPAQRH